MNAFYVKCNTWLEWFNLLVILRVTTLKKNFFWLPQDYKASLEKLDKPWTIPKSTHNVIRFTWLKQKKRNFLVILKQTFLDKKVKATSKQHISISDWKKVKPYTAWKVSLFGVFLVHNFPHLTSPYSVQMRENTDQKNSEYRHFSRSFIEKWSISLTVVSRYWSAEEAVCRCLSK